MKIFVTVVCSECKNSFERELTYIKRNIKSGQENRYCSRNCSLKNARNKLSENRNRFNISKFANNRYD